MLLLIGNLDDICFLSCLRASVDLLICCVIVNCFSRRVDLNLYLLEAIFTVC